LLTIAHTHPSYQTKLLSMVQEKASSLDDEIYEAVKYFNYERFEVIGDKIIGFCLSRELYLETHEKVYNWQE
jgi:dsRNA-specific ribonuclease